MLAAAIATQRLTTLVLDRRQAVADAYYILSDPTRRREYDELRSARSERTTDPNASANFFSTFANMFGSAAGAGTAGADAVPPGQQPNAEHVFGDVFEEVRSARHYIRPHLHRQRLYALLRTRSSGRVVS